MACDADCAYKDNSDEFQRGSESCGVVTGPCGGELLMSDLSIALSLSGEADIVTRSR